MLRTYDIAPRVTVYPSGSAPPPVGEGWIALAQLPRAESSAVFGDGSHATTRLCATAVDMLCRRRQSQAVRDGGTGTGILARIARARGARLIVGTDIDSVAVSCAKAHADLDAHRVEIQFGSEAPDHWGACFDLVVANILEAPLRTLAPALRRALAPGGILLISGFTRLQIPALRVAYESAGLTYIDHFGLDEWAALKLASNR
jgi:ribosomal protein L11 methyltransferase